ncbi:RAMA domain-containing protein [Caerostris darwini]|uniref:RAMA domain-containing protein n=1 Tax=Caerostris darwini TaxID=1538125 RepID=A0AAV4ULH6_9ARAC|nr:RAMA domain-containing protein [Caerostris darwini]
MHHGIYRWQIGEEKEEMSESETQLPFEIISESEMSEDEDENSDFLNIYDKKLDRNVKSPEIPLLHSIIPYVNRASEEKYIKRNHESTFDLKKMSCDYLTPKCNDKVDLLDSCNFNIDFSSLIDHDLVDSLIDNLNINTLGSQKSLTNYHNDIYGCRSELKTQENKFEIEDIASVNNPIDKVEKPGVIIWPNNSCNIDPAKTNLPNKDSQDSLFQTPTSSDDFDYSQPLFETPQSPKMSSPVPSPNNNSISILTENISSQLETPSTFVSKHSNSNVHNDVSSQQSFSRQFSQEIIKGVINKSFNKDLNYLKTDTKDNKINLIQSNNDTIVSWKKQDEKNQFSKVNSEIFHEKTDLSDVDVFNESKYISEKPLENALNANIFNKKSDSNKEIIKDSKDLKNSNDIDIKLNLNNGMLSTKVCTGLISRENLQLQRNSDDEHVSFNSEQNEKIGENINEPDSNSPSLLDACVKHKNADIVHGDSKKDNSNSVLYESKFDYVRSITVNEYPIMKINLKKCVIESKKYMNEISDTEKIKKSLTINENIGDIEDKKENKNVKKIFKSKSTRRAVRFRAPWKNNDTEENYKVLKMKEQNNTNENSPRINKEINHKDDVNLINKIKINTEQINPSKRNICVNKVNTRSSGKELSLELQNKRYLNNLSEAEIDTNKSAKDCDNQRNSTGYDNNRKNLDIEPSGQFNQQNSTTVNHIKNDNSNSMNIECDSNVNDSSNFRQKRKRPEISINSSDNKLKELPLELQNKRYLNNLSEAEIDTNKSATDFDDQRNSTEYSNNRKNLDIESSGQFSQQNSTTGNHTKNESSNSRNTECDSDVNNNSKFRQKRKRHEISVHSNSNKLTEKSNEDLLECFENSEQLEEVQELYFSSDTENLSNKFKRKRKRITQKTKEQCYTLDSVNMYSTRNKKRKQMSKQIVFNHNNESFQDNLCIPDKEKYLLEQMENKLVSLSKVLKDNRSSDKKKSQALKSLQKLNSIIQKTEISYSKIKSGQSIGINHSTRILILSKLKTIKLCCKNLINKKGCSEELNNPFSYNNCSSNYLDNSLKNRKDYKGASQNINQNDVELILSSSPESKAIHQYNMDKSEMKSIDVAGEGEINSRNIHDSPAKALSHEEEIVCSDEENTTGNTNLSTEENSGCNFELVQSSNSNEKFTQCKKSFNDSVSNLNEAINSDETHSFKDLQVIQVENENKKIIMNTSPIQLNDVTKNKGPIILKFVRSPNSDANSISLLENFTTNKKFMNTKITATPVHEPSNIMDENNKLNCHSFMNSNSNESDETQFLLNQDSSLRENPFEKEHNELLTKSSTEKCNYLPEKEMPTLSFFAEKEFESETKNSTVLSELQDQELNTLPKNNSSIKKENYQVYKSNEKYPVGSMINSIQLTKNYNPGDHLLVDKQQDKVNFNNQINIRSNSCVNKNSNLKPAIIYVANAEKNYTNNHSKLKSSSNITDKNNSIYQANNLCPISLNETLKQIYPKPPNRICSSGANYSSCVTESYHNEDHHINLTKNTLPKNLSAIVNESTVPVTSMSNPTNEQTKKNLNTNQIIKKRNIISLIKLIQHDLLKPGENVLSVHTPETIIFASLDSNGKIISNGEIYNTPLQWYCNIPNIFKHSQKIIKSKDCYDRIYYQGRTLSNLVKIYYQRLENQNTSQRVEESSIMLSSCSGLEVTQRSTAPQGVTSLDSAAPISETNVLNLGKMKLLLIGDNEVGPISERDQWDDIDKWDC